MATINHPVESAYFGGGCFWCTEAVFSRLKGVIGVNPGYAGGTTQNPTYDQVCTNSTGHAEAVKIDFNPHQLKYDQLLAVFFSTHDPTTFNQQGADVGSQYRSIIFYANPIQKQTALDMIRKLEKEKVYTQPIVTQLAPLTIFYPAEPYHVDYYAKHSQDPYCQIVINPKLKKLKHSYAALLK